MEAFDGILSVQSNSNVTPYVLALILATKSHNAVKRCLLGYKAV
jgi:hypothetical protein